MRDNRGFTLVELVVVIAIMGVILILALPQVSKIQSANKDKKYDAYYQSIESAAKLYIDSKSKDLFGSNTSGCVTVRYSELKSQNLIKDFGSNDIICSNDSETYVEIRKVNSTYLYSTFLTCRDDNGIVYESEATSSDEPCTNKPHKIGPKVEITPSSSDWTQSKNLKIKIKISDEYTLNKNIGIIYYWTNSSGSKVGSEYTYSYKNKKGVKTVSYEIPTKNIPTASGQYRLVVKPWYSSTSSGIQDALGNQTITDTSAGVYKIDNTKPTCGTVSGDKTTWTKDNFTIYQYCSDDASGCTKSPYSKLFTSSTKTYTFNIADKAGNTNTCKVNVYLDVDEPTCGTTRGESQVWTNQSRKISVECKDTGGSGCAKSPFETTFIDEGKTDEITISDVAGNTTDCTVDKYIDKTPPNCPTISPTKAQKVWTKDNISFTFGFTSDTVSWDWYTDSNGNYKFWDNNKTSSKSKTISGSGKRKIMVRVYDTAGNYKDCFTDHQYWIDKVGPTTPTSGSIGAVSGSNKNASIKNEAGGSTDSYSGLSHYLYMVTNDKSKPSNTDSGFKTSKTFTRSCGKSYYAWAVAVDNLGNRSAVYSLGSTSDGADSYGSWGGCNATCPNTSGTKYRSNSCALVTEGLSTSCSISCGPPSHTHVIGYTGTSLRGGAYASIEDRHGYHSSSRYGYCKICWDYGVKYRCARNTGCWDDRTNGWVDWNYNCPISPYYPIVVPD